MGIEYQTVFVCDRCGTQRCYVNDVRHDEADAEWVTFLPAIVVPFRSCPPMSRRRLLCVGCLTDSERAELVEIRGEIQLEEQFPF